MGMLAIRFLFIGSDSKKRSKRLKEQHEKRNTSKIF